MDPRAPMLLSETGLYADLSVDETLAPGVEAFRPRYELWSDGASKRRWLWLPPGTQIEASNPDFWTYPIGTRAWKEFERDGIRVETRFMHKVTPETWLFMAYHWDAEQTEARAVPNGLVDASDTDHDIPSVVDCGICHKNVPDRLLGVSAVQLAHAFDGLTLAALAESERINPPGRTTLEPPGDIIARFALGYLHANCGFCHNPRSNVHPQVHMDLWLATSSLTAVESTPTYLTTVGVPLEGVPASPDVPNQRIRPGAPEDSAVYHRMSVRELTLQMPPIASELTDPTGLSSLAEWIRSLEAQP